MITLQNYHTDTQRLLHDSSYRFCTQQELTDYINKARKLIAAESGCTRQLAPVNIAASTTLAGSTYSMDTLVTNRRVTDVLDILINYSVNTVYQLKYLPFSTMVRTGLWQIQNSGTPSHYTINGRNVYIVQWPNLPYPTSMFDCLLEPLDLAALTDPDADIPFPYSECVGFYAAHLVKIKNQQRQEAEDFMGDYHRRKMQAIGTEYTRRLVGR